MKISKVDHKRMGVVVKKKGESQNTLDTVKGEIYKVPTGGVGLEAELKKRNRNVQILYNIFCEVKTKKKEDRAVATATDKQQIKDEELKNKCAKYLKEVRCDVTEILFNKYPKSMYKNEDIILNMQYRDSEKKKKRPSLPKFDGDLESFVILSLRKSLAVDKICDSKTNKVITFDSRKAAVIFLKNIGNIDISREDKKQIELFLNLVRNDFMTWDPEVENSKGAWAVKAIANQNMAVQPKNGNFVLPAIKGKNASDDKAKKAREKEGLNTFLKDYARLDPETRIEMLRKLRRIIDVFFAAPEDREKNDYSLPNVVVTEDKCEFDVWKRHENAKKVQDNFVEISAKLLNAEKSHEKIDAVTKKKLSEKLKKDIRSRNIACYRYACGVIEKDNNVIFFEDQNVNRFWIRHAEDAVERILNKCGIGTLFKLRVGYLSEKVWKDAINLLSVKYIAIGKSVFYFAMDDMWNESEKMKLGTIIGDVEPGISSFDYEMIKAGEELQRETAVAVAFSANNLARATVNADEAVDEKSDFLSWNENDIKAYLKYRDENKEPTQGETLRAIMQFFGGMSSWKKDVEFEKYLCIKGSEDNVRQKDNTKQESYEVGFLRDLQRAIYAVRNESFHFKTKTVDNCMWNENLFGYMFGKEAESALTVEKDKFYSNNLPMFYNDNDLRKILDVLYFKTVSRASQVPAYNTILPRTQFNGFVSELGLKYAANDTPENREKWYSALYYLFKEVYYNLFLQDGSAKEIFDRNVNGLNEDGSCKDGNANREFKKRYNELKDEPLEKICQAFMTDYNQQNNQIRKVRRSKSNSSDEPIYQHYKMILNDRLKTTFAEYIKNFKCKDSEGKEVNLKFLEIPTVFREKSSDEFLPEWTSKKYEDLINNVKVKKELQKWYIVGKFLNPKKLNLLIGSMRSYLQYTEDVEKRAKIAGSVLHVKKQRDTKEVEDIIKVLEVCLLTAMRISGGNKEGFKDYFKDEEEYAGFLENYADFETDKRISKWQSLLDFSERNKTDLYTDAKEPKLNRNMISAKLFAPDIILKNVFKKVNEEDIKNFRSMKGSVAVLKNKGSKLTQEEQKRILEYQKLKNKVELTYLAEYGELINDLLSRLINFSFLRERDLMYFQLGFHYYCVLNDKEAPDAYKKLSAVRIRKDENNEEAINAEIDNAILYQIAAMYIGGFGVLRPKTEKDIKKYDAKIDGKEIIEGDKIAGAGIKIGDFLKYSRKIEKEKDAFYNAGLELFEVVAEHEDIIGLRNKIDHFRYYSGKENLLAMYGEVFDRFFTYDMKYQKNVLNDFENILLRHKVIVRTKISTGEKTVTKKITKPCAIFCVDKISSDRFTYNVIDGKLEIDAKDEDYLETVRDILYLNYPDTGDGKGSDIRESAKTVTDKDKFMKDTGKLKKDTVRFTKGNYRSKDKK